MELSDARIGQLAHELFEAHREQLPSAARGAPWEALPKAEHAGWLAAARWSVQAVARHLAYAAEPAQVATPGPDLSELRAADAQEAKARGAEKVLSPMPTNDPATCGHPFAISVVVAREVKKRCASCGASLVSEPEALSFTPTRLGSLVRQARERAGADLPHVGGLSPTLLQGLQGVPPARPPKVFDLLAPFNADRKHIIECTHTRTQSTEQGGIVTRKCRQCLKVLETLACSHPAEKQGWFTEGPGSPTQGMCMRCDMILPERPLQDAEVPPAACSHAHTISAGDGSVRCEACGAAVGWSR